eukprot:1354533-Amorphochlora_amoeboformis.AAC.2
MASMPIYYCKYGYYMYRYVDMYQLQDIKFGYLKTSWPVWTRTKWTLRVKEIPAGARLIFPWRKYSDADRGMLSMAM